MRASLNEIEQLVGQPERGAVALYRLPDDNVFTLVLQRQSPLVVAQAYEAVDGAKGYVVAPFSLSAGTPLLVVPGDEWRVCACPDRFSLASRGLSAVSATSRSDYGRTFRRCRDAIRQGRFGKLVLSRCATYRCADEPLRLFDLFLAACCAYPHQYVAVWDTPLTDSWLVATPEKLLSTLDGHEWQTMALAGTMDWNAQSAHPELRAWSAKNRREQRFVTDYLCDRIDAVADSRRVGTPYPVRAGNVAHLRTDVTFRSVPACLLSRLLRVLHPTPAVCGVPREEAERFLVQTEGYDRRYYAGFSGPLKPDGGVSLYVSLRCMQFEADRIHCYAGGGLLAESEEEAEWHETQRKMRTMLDLFEKRP